MPEHSACGSGWRLVGTSEIRRSRQAGDWKVQVGWGSGDRLTVEKKGLVQGPWLSQVLCFVGYLFAFQRRNDFIISHSWHGNCGGECLLPKKQVSQDKSHSEPAAPPSTSHPAPTLNLSNPGPGLPFPPASDFFIIQPLWICILLVCLPSLLSLFLSCSPLLCSLMALFSLYPSRCL